MTAPLLEVQDLTRTYAMPREHLWVKPPVVNALQGVSFVIESGRSLGVVGESGSGKSTLARLVMALEPPSSGRVRMLGQDLNLLSASALRDARRDFQMVFQDPYGSLDPRQTVEHIVTEPLAAQAKNASKNAADDIRSNPRLRAREVLESVGLRDSDLDKYPHEFSGGQRQRIAIARALITRPKLIVADEPVSALDVSVQAQVLNLMQDLQQQFGVTYLLISHDLAVVNHLCDEVAVIFQGRIVEQAAPQVLFSRAAHPYTRALLDAVPLLEPRAIGNVNGPRKRTIQLAHTSRPASACPYAHRCPDAVPQCDASRPQLKPLASVDLTSGHWVACHLAS